MPITTWSHNVGIWSYTRPIQLEPFSPCPPQLLGCDIQSPQITRILGQQGHQRVVHWAVNEPLPLQPFLHPQDSSPPRLRIRGTLPEILSSAIPNVDWAPLGGHWWTRYNVTWAPTGERRLCSRTRHWQTCNTACNWTALLPQTHESQMAPSTCRPAIDAYIPPPQQRVEQRVIGGEVEQENVHNDPHPVLTHITDAQPIMAAPNPTTKQALKLTKQTHSRQTRNNIPGSVPPIANANQCPIVVKQPIPTPPLQWSPQTAAPIWLTAPIETASPTHIPQVQFVPIKGGYNNTG